MSRVCATRQSSSHVSGAHRAGAGRECWQSARKRLERFCGHRAPDASRRAIRGAGSWPRAWRAPVRREMRSAARGPDGLTLIPTDTGDL